MTKWIKLGYPPLSSTSPAPFCDMSQPWAPPSVLAQAGKMKGKWRGNEKTVTCDSPKHLPWCCRKKGFSAGDFIYISFTLYNTFSRKSTLRAKTHIHKSTRTVPTKWSAATPLFQGCPDCTASKGRPRHPSAILPLRAWDGTNHHPSVNTYHT